MMKIPMTLMLLAATLVPADAAPVPMAERISKLNAVSEPNAAPEASAVQLARLYPALAHLPKGVGDFLTVNLDDTLELAGGAESTGTDLPASSFALGSNAASPAFYRVLNKIMSSLKEQPAPAMGEEPAPRNPKAETELNQALTELCKHSMQPVYLALIARPGEEERLTATAMAAVHNPFFTPSKNLPEGCVAGACLNWDALLAGRELTPETKASLKQRPLHLLAHVQGKAATLILCEKPEELHLPGTPSASVLGTAAAKAACSMKAGQKPLIALHLSPSFMKAVQEANWGSVAEEALTLGKGALADSAAVVAQYCRERAEAALTHPTVLRVSKDSKGVSATASMDAQGMDYKSGKYRLMPLADTASTIFYVESTPRISPPRKHDMSKLMEAAARLYTGSLSPDEEGDGAPAFSMSVHPMALGAAAGATTALGTLADGLEGTLGLVVDGKGKAPVFLGGKAGSAFPRLGIYAGISERELLVKGWRQVEKLLAGIGLAEGSLPIETKSAGKATRYSIAHELFTPDFMPNVMLAGKHLVAGTTPALNVSLLKAAAGGKGRPTGQGAVFIFRPGAMVNCAAGVGAGAVSALADVVENVHGITTVEEGVFSLKLRVDFTPGATK